MQSSFVWPYVAQCLRCGSTLGRENEVELFKAKIVGHFHEEDIVEFSLNCAVCNANIVFVQDPVCNSVVCVNDNARLVVPSHNQDPLSSQVSLLPNDLLMRKASDPQVHCNESTYNSNSTKNHNADRTSSIKCAIFDEDIGVPFCSEVEVMLTDYYQITMTYVYWKNNIHRYKATFEVFFRKCPFNGEFAIFAGLNELLRFLNTFHFTNKQLHFIKEKFPNFEDKFIEYLRNINGSELTLYGILEGKMVFASEPLIRLEGPLGICQIVETPVLNMLNYATLVATNAARFRLLAGWKMSLFEFGARRAQGGDGAMSASRYSYLGGFDGTSNLKAGFLFNIPLKGTQAHSFISSCSKLDKSQCQVLGTCNNFVDLVFSMKEKGCNVLSENNLKEAMHEGELMAFIAYAQAFPESCVCLVDTYDTLLSGVPNFLSVALALSQLNFQPVGIRLDSGDIAYLSKEARKMFELVSASLNVDFSNLKIIASNDINEKVLQLLKEMGNEIDILGIGTNLVTCQAQPALGMVYKLVELIGEPCMKFSQETQKSSLPGKKNLFRFYSESGIPIGDFIQLAGKEQPPNPNELILCRYIFNDAEGCCISPTKVENLLLRLFSKGKATIHVDQLQVLFTCILYIIKHWHMLV